MVVLVKSSKFDGNKFLTKYENVNIIIGPK